MAMRDNSPVDAHLIQALLAEIQGLRLDVAALRSELQAQRPPAAAPQPSSATTWLQRPNAERLAAEVQRRQALQLDGADAGDTDTELDLLIDRLHDLALDNGR